MAEERNYLLPMLSVIHCPTVSEEILWTTVDLQLNIFYHITPLNTLFAVEKATHFTSQEIKVNKWCLYRLDDWFDLFIARTRMEIWAVLLGNEMGPQ